MLKWDEKWDETWTPQELRQLDERWHQQGLLDNDEPTEVAHLAHTIESRAEFTPLERQMIRVLLIPDEAA